MTKAVATEIYNFEKLLGWLDNDREIAGQKYETIRLQLTKIFYARGVRSAEELADVTIDRVTNKMSTLANKYEGDPALYFYAVGKRVFWEYTRKPRTEEFDDRIASAEISDDLLEIRDRCLTRCMNSLTSKRYRLIAEYHNGEKTEKIRRRKKLATDLGISNKVLRIRAFRIRESLKKCIQKCVNARKTETI